MIIIIKIKMLRIFPNCKTLYKKQHFKFRPLVGSKKQYKAHTA